MASVGVGDTAKRPVSAAVTAMRCEQHGRTGIQQYCKSHKTPICDLCLPDLHRSCKDIVPMEKMIHKLGKGKNLKKFTTDLDAVRQSLKKLKKKRQSDQSRLRHDTDEAIRDIRVFRNDITAVLDHLERKGKDYIERRYKALGKAISDDIACLESMIIAVEELQDAMARLSEPAEKFEGMNDGATTIGAAKDLLDELKTSRDNNDMVKFKVDPKVEAFAMKLNWYGKDRTFLSFEPPVSLPHLYTAKLDGQFDIKAKGDKNVCHVGDACALEDGTMLLMDVANNKIKQLDVSCRVVDFLDLPYSPTALCQMHGEKYTVAVCMIKPERSSSLIKFLTVESNISSTGQVEVPHTCYGMAYLDDKLYITTGYDVLVYSVDGTHSHVFYNGSGPGAVKHILKGPGDKIHVVDANIGLMTIDATGEVLHSSLDGDLRDVCSLCLDHHGQVFVCTQERSVVQVGHDNQRIGFVLKDSKELKNISCIGYDRMNGRLVIARTGTNFIKVMELK